jgi:hypothetical protein
MNPFLQILFRARRYFRSMKAVLVNRIKKNVYSIGFQINDILSIIITFF